jgi:hypothetical protein
VPSVKAWKQKWQAPTLINVKHLFYLFEVDHFTIPSIL